MVPGALPMWLMVKNYLLQYILLEATYLRSTCCITGKPHRHWQRKTQQCSSSSSPAGKAMPCWDAGTAGTHLAIVSSVRAASTQHACMSVWVCEYCCMPLPACWLAVHCRCQQHR